MSTKAKRLKMIKDFVDAQATPEDCANQSTMCKLVAQKVGGAPEEKVEFWEFCMRRPRSPEEIASFLTGDMTFRYPDVKPKTKREEK